MHKTDKLTSIYIGRPLLFVIYLDWLSLAHRPRLPVFPKQFLISELNTLINFGNFKGINAFKVINFCLSEKYVNNATLQN